MQAKKNLIRFALFVFVGFMLCGLLLISTGMITSMLIFVATDDSTPKLRTRRTRIIPPTPMPIASGDEEEAVALAEAISIEATGEPVSTESVQETITQAIEPPTIEPTSRPAEPETNASPPTLPATAEIVVVATVPPNVEGVSSPTATGVPTVAPTIEPIASGSTSAAPTPTTSPTVTAEASATPKSSDEFVDFENNGETSDTTSNETATFTPEPSATFTATPEPSATVTETPEPAATATPIPTATDVPDTPTPEAVGIRGKILVDGSSEGGIRLQLENQSYQVIAETETNDNGEYEFDDVSSSDEGYNILFSSQANSRYGESVISWGAVGPIRVDNRLIEVADFDVSLRGFEQVNPSPNSNASVHSILSGDSLTFEWTTYPSASGYWIDLTAGEQMAVVWQSSLVDGTSIKFDGRLNNGQNIEPGNYWWGVGIQQNMGDYTITRYSYLPALNVNP